MKFRFREGSRVAVREDHPGLKLGAGTEGTVWACYDRTPPAYEVTFEDDRGTAFDALMQEDEIQPAPQVRGNRTQVRPPTAKSA